MSSKALYHKYLGSSAAEGYANFFKPGTTTAKVTYTDKDYDTAQTTDVSIDANGWLKSYLIGDYDVKVYDKNGVQLTSASAEGINPQSSSSANEINLIVNGSFETDSDNDNTPDNWDLTSYSGSTNQLITSDQAHGAKAMNFISTGSGGGFVISSDYMLVDELASYNVSFSLKSSVADIRNVVEVVWYDSSFSELSTTTVYDESTGNPTSWARKNKQISPASTAVYAKIRLTGGHSGDSTAGNTSFDNVVLIEADQSSFVEEYEHNKDEIFDNFVANTLNSNIWSVFSGSDAQAADPVISTAGRVVFVSGNDAAASMAVNGSQIFGPHAFGVANSGAGNIVFETKIKIDDITNVCIFVGVTDDVTSLSMPFTLGASDALTSNEANAAGFLFDTAADTDNIWLVGVDTNVDATHENTGIAFVNDTYKTLRIEIDTSGNAFFYIDGSRVGVQMTDAVATNVNLAPTIAVFSRTSASRTLTCARCYMKSDEGLD